MNSKSKFLSLISVGVFAVSVNVSAAESSGGLSREQVRAELAEAVRTGDLPADAILELKLYQVHPDRYPQPAAVAGKTRAQVQAELAEAVRSGEFARYRVF